MEHGEKSVVTHILKLTTGTSLPERDEWGKALALFKSGKAPLLASCTLPLLEVRLEELDLTAFCVNHSYYRP